MTKIRKFKTVEEWSVEEHHAAIQAKARGEELKFETDEWKEAVKAALADAGLDGDDADADEEDDADDGAPTTDAKLGGMSVDDHFEAITRKEA